MSEEEQIKEILAFAGSHVNKKIQSGASGIDVAYFWLEHLPLPTINLSISAEGIRSMDHISLEVMSVVGLLAQAELKRRRNNDERGI